MFGYFRFNQLYASPKIKRVYKNYYCGACFALEYNYGQIARFILSYDVVILALIAKLYNDPQRELLPCFFKKKHKSQFFNDDNWRKLAAINILLMRAKLDDDINDDASKTAKVASKVFYSAIKKAGNEYPQLERIINEGYSRMYTLEKSKCDILDICDEFSSMMIKLVTEAYEIDSKKIDFINAISRWLYFIDQLDDYDDDVKEGKYNPLIVEGISKSQIINNEHKQLFAYLKKLFRDFDMIKKSLDMNCPEDYLLYSILNESIPCVTTLVLTNRNLPQIVHSKKELEWKDLNEKDQYKNNN